MLDFPFKNIDSTEISSKLAEFSIKFYKLKNNKVKTFNQDAYYFKHYNNHKYFYLYNPFPEMILNRIFNQINKQIMGKEIFIIYNNLVWQDLRINSNFLLVEKFPDACGNRINLRTKSL